MQLGVQVTGEYDHLLEIARITEASPAVALALADHYLYGSGPDDYNQPAYDSLVQAAALARDTSRVEIVMLVSPITFRHPAVYAKSALSIDELAGGRFILGLGTGWHDDEHAYHGLPFPERKTRFTQLAEAMEYVHSYFDQPERGFDGAHFRFVGFDSRPRARRTGRRLLVGGSGAVKTPALAGRHADEYNLYHHEPEGIAKRLEVMRRSADESQRDPDAIRVSTCLPMIGGDSEGDLIEVVAAMPRSSDRHPAELLAHYREIGVKAATWEEHRDWLGRIRAAGIELTYLQLAARVGWHLERALAELS